MKLRRILYSSTAALIFLVVFTIDVIRRNVELDIGGLNVFRDLMIVGAFVLIYLFLRSSDRHAATSPVRKLGLLMIYAVLMVVIAAGLASIGPGGFDSKDLSLVPLEYSTLFVATLLGVSFGVFAVLVIRQLRDLVLYKRKRSTGRNLLIFITLALLTSASALMLKPLEKSVLTNILFGFAVLFAVINSFRLSWIVYLTKREKIFGLIYGFFLFIAFLILNILIGQSTTISRSLLYYSYPLEEFVFLVAVFGNIYFGMAFISTLFHLPTAEAFDRKTTEVSSLHNLSKLVTQVFDFDELVETVTSMTLQVCEAKSCWLEVIYYPEDVKGKRIHADEIVAYSAAGGDYHVRIVGMKNIEQKEIDALFSGAERSLRDVVLEERKPIVIDDLRRDSRFKHMDKSKTRFASLVVVPLVSHAGLSGILYATKDAEYGFFKDDVDVISAFADHATIAIENSRLIKKSIERERLLREMTVAQEIQRKLLPQKLPSFPTLELDAVSTPAFEVGGDYYDFVYLDSNRLGIVVGDVSGKGVSAAFYMSEVKGIFQSLSRLYPSPKEFMVKANEALATSIDKHSFVSLIYAVLDVATGVLTLSRAGHCPLLHISGEKVDYVRPSGMGLGMHFGPTFANTIEETNIHLKYGDVCVFYTDGITEARRGDDEFGYERLLDTVVRSRNKSASALKDDILDTVKLHIDRQAHDDDLTLVVLKWRGRVT